MTNTLGERQAMDAFLGEPRLAMLLTNRKQQAPMGVPVWFEWTGTTIEMFAAKGSAKLRRIERDPMVSVLVTNRVGEPEGWVAFDGKCEVLSSAPGALITRLGSRYWDLTNPDKNATLKSWAAAEENFVNLRVRPTRTRSGS